MTTPTKDQLAEVARQLWDAATTLENDGEFYAKYVQITDYNKHRRQAIYDAMVRLKLKVPWREAAPLFPAGATSTDREIALREYLRVYLDSAWDMDSSSHGEMEVAGQRARAFVQDNPLDFTSEAVRYPKPRPPKSPQPKSPQPKETTTSTDPYEHLRQAIRDGKTVEWRSVRGGTWRPLVGAVSDRKFLDPVDQYRIVEPDPLTTAFNAATVLQPITQPTPKEPTMNVTTPLTITTKTLVNGMDVASLSDSQVYDLIAQQEAEIKKLDAIENKPKRLVDEIAKRKAGIAALVAHLDSQVKK